jgi:bacteriocin-like protein
MDITKLELSVETLRELNDDELAKVNGGAQAVTNLCLTGTETYNCPIIGPTGVTYHCG